MDNPDALLESIGDSVADSVEAVLPPLVRRQVQDMRAEVESAVERSVERLVALQVGKAVAEYIARLPQARDGKDGRDGFLTPTTHWVPGTYQMHAVVTHRGGMWQATRATVDEPGEEYGGWLAVAAGLDTVHCTQSVDGREVTHVLRLSTGIEHEYTTHHAVAVHRGLWQDDIAYRMGNEVASDGGTWRALCDSPAGPPPGDDWVLAAQRGPRGKRGEQGECGAPGETGPRGLRGEPGERGEKGERGTRGSRGERGRGITDFEQAGDGTVRARFSDGTLSSVIRMPVGPPGPIGPSGESLRWRGVFVAGETYRPGDSMTFDSALWFCREETTQAPAAAPMAWQRMAGGLRARSGGASPTALQNHRGPAADMTAFATLGNGLFIGELVHVTDRDGAGNDGAFEWDGTAWQEQGGSGSNLVTQTFVATAAQTTFTLARAPSNANNTQLQLRGTSRDYGTDFTVAGITVTLTMSGVTVFAGDTVIVQYD